MMSLSGSSGRTMERAPFTATQWEELERQALIYKYMVSGVPVPPELIFSIRRSLDTSLVSRLLPHQSIGWGCYQMGFGRKPDPEPGRCRRTDGKKWRCSREAYPDSKYCEKHMHRGRNRARKSLDHQNQTIPLTTQTLTSSSSTSSASASSSSSSMDAYTNTNKFINGGNSRSYINNHSLHDYPYPKQPLDHVSALSLYHNTSSTSHFNVLTSPTDHNKDFRYFQGIGERTFFPEASRNFQDSPYQQHHQPLATVLNDPYNHCTDKVQHTYSSSSSSHHHLRQQEQQQQCFVLGADMFNKSSRIALGNTSKSQEDHQEEEMEKDSSESKKSLHHFFGEDWTQNKNTSDSWLDLSSSHSRLNTGS